MKTFVFISPLSSLVSAEEIDSVYPIFLQSTRREILANREPTIMVEETTKISLRARMVASDSLIPMLERMNIDYEIIENVADEEDEDEAEEPVKKGRGRKKEEPEIAEEDDAPSLIEVEIELNAEYEVSRTIPLQETKNYIDLSERYQDRILQHQHLYLSALRTLSEVSTNLEMQTDMESEDATAPGASNNRAMYLAHMLETQQREKRVAEQAVDAELQWFERNILKTKYDEDGNIIVAEEEISAAEVYPLFTTPGVAETAYIDFMSDVQEEMRSFLVPLGK